MQIPFPFFGKKPQPLSALPPLPQAQLAVVIHPAAPSHVAGIARLHEQAWCNMPVGWLSDAFLEKCQATHQQLLYSAWLAAPERLVLVAINNQLEDTAEPAEDPLAGFIMLTRNTVHQPNTFGWWLDTICICPAHRGQHVGRRLFTAARHMSQGAADGLLAWAFAADATLQRFYHNNAGHPLTTRLADGFHPKLPADHHGPHVAFGWPPLVQPTS